MGSEEEGRAGPPRCIASASSLTTLRLLAGEDKTKCDDQSSAEDSLAGGGDSETVSDASNAPPSTMAALNSKAKAKSRVSGKQRLRLKAKQKKSCFAKQSAPEKPRRYRCCGVEVATTMLCARRPRGRMLDGGTAFSTID